MGVIYTKTYQSSLGQQFLDGLVVNVFCSKFFSLKMWQYFLQRIVRENEIFFEVMGHNDEHLGFF